MPPPSTGLVGLRVAHMERRADRMEWFGRGTSQRGAGLHPTTDRGERRQRGISRSPSHNTPLATRLEHTMAASGTQVTGDLHARGGRAGARAAEPDELEPDQRRVHLKRQVVVSLVRSCVEENTREETQGAHHALGLACGSRGEEDRRKLARPVLGLRPHGPARVSKHGIFPTQNKERLNGLPACPSSAPCTATGGSQHPPSLVTPLKTVK